MGVLQQVNRDRDMATGMYGSLSRMEQQRQGANDQLKNNHRANQANMAGGALAMGVQAGMMGGPGIGLAVGVGSMLFGSLF